jgi:HEPN domain-containing protein
MSGDEARSWLEKAKGDLDVVRRSLMLLPDKNLEAAAYHCQQAAEKSIKALLVHLNIAYPRGGGRGHDLGLAASMTPTSHGLYLEALALAPLTPWATAYRYPSDDPATAPAVPSDSDIEKWLEKIERFMARIESEMTPPPSTDGGK